MLARPRIPRALPIAALALAAATTAAPAAVISLDFYANTGPAAQAIWPTSPITGDTTTTPATNKTNLDGLMFTGQTGTWNALPVRADNNTGLAQASGFLLDGAGALTTVQFSHGNYRSSTLSGDAGQAAFSDLRREAPRLHLTLSAQTMNWSIFGLTPNAEYQLVLFGVATNVSTLANTVAGVRDSENDLNWASIFADGAGAISGQFAISGLPNNATTLTAFQIVAVESANVPAPGGGMAAVALTLTAATRRPRRSRNAA